MKHTTIALALSFAFVNFVQAGNNVPEVEIIKTENQRWHFHKVTANHTDTELTVSGRINAHQRYGLPWGHVDIAAWSADNHRLIAETATDYSPGRLTKRASRKGGVRFSAKLPTLPADARITVSFHPSELRSHEASAHN